MVDKLTICAKCGSDACYESKVDQITGWLCVGCGFTTNTLMENESEYIKNAEEGMPELYKDLKHVDADNRAWYPSTLTYPEQGMVFVYGTSKDDWKWAGVKAVEVKEEEKEKFKKPNADQLEGDDKYYSYRMDMETLKLFERKDFMEAGDYIGLFSKENLAS